MLVEERCVLSQLSRVRRFCDPTDHSQPGSSVHELLQARILEWVAMPSSRAGNICATKTTKIIITNERHKVMTQMNVCYFYSHWYSINIS